jgi:O-antigen/teichoic acid export membrane protein
VRDALKKLLSESAVYGLGQALGRAAQLALVPILTRVLAPDAYGISDLLLAYSQTAVLVLVFGMDGALARHFYAEPDRAARVRMASTSFLFRLAIGALAALAVSAAASPLAGQLLGGAVYRKYLLIAAWTLPFTLLTLWANEVLRVTFQPWKYVGLNVLQTVLSAGLAVYWVVVVKVGVVGVLYGKLAADLACAALGLVLCRHNLGPHLRTDVLKRMLAYGAPLVPSAFAFGAIGSLDRWWLQHTRSLDEVAVYAVAMKFYAVMGLSVAAVQLAYGPFAFARAREPGAPRLFAFVFDGYVAGASLMAMLASAFAPEILRVVVPGGYAPAAAPVVPLTFAAVALGAYTIASVGIGLALRTPLLSVAAVGGALAAWAAQAALTPRLGAPGAAAGTLIGYVAAAVLTYRVAQRVHPLPYRPARLLTLFASALALAWVLATRVAATPGGGALKLGAALAWAALAAAWVMRKERGVNGTARADGPAA